MSGAPWLSLVLAGRAADEQPPPLPPGVEVVVVTTGDGEDDDPGEPVRRVTVDKQAPFGAVANRGLAATTGRTVVLLTDGTEPAGDLPAVARLLTEPAGPSALLPHVVDPDGRLVEAGASIRPDGTLVPVPLEPEEAGFGRQVEATSYGAMALRRSAFTAVGGFHALAPDPATAIVEIGLELRRRRLAVWAHPAFRLRASSAARGRTVDVSWLASLRPEAVAELTAPLPPASPSAALAARDARAGDRILLIHSGVPAAGSAVADHRSAAMIDSFAALWPDARVTLLAADGGPATDAGALAGRGVEVVPGPRDWRDWFERRLGHYTHVVVTGVGLEHRFAPLLAATQPQAARVLAPDLLDFRGPASLHPALRAPAEEGLALAELTATVRERVAASVLRSQAVWCGSELDRTFVEALAPGLPTAVVPGGLAASGRVFHPPERRGVLVLASPGSDALAGHEDAAALAAREVFPLLRAADPDLVLTVITERPSPFVLHLAELPGVVLSAPDPDPVAAFSTTRLVLAPYRHGTGGRRALALAMAGGAPFVTTTLGAQGSDLPAALAARTVAADLATLVQRGRELLGDPAAWKQVQDAVLVASGRHGEHGLRATLVEAAADLGIAPPHARTRVPEPVPGGGAGVTGPPPPAPLVPIPPRFRQPRRTEPLAPEPADSQYRRWRARFAPSPQRLAEIRGAAAAASYRPTISVVMPTYDTDPEVLEAAIASVAEQVYDGWELCIADDCSPSAATRAALDRWAGADDRVRVRHLDANRGISGATNAALEMASGDYVAFMDHDDELKPHALAEVVLLLAGDPGLDVVYTDEDKRDDAGRLVEPFFKPDWSPDHLMSRNYLSHLTVIRRSLVEQVGGLRPGYDGSQDYDLLLRVTELTERVGHVPEPLYTWRRVAGSTAAVVDAKPYAFDAAKRALRDALVRRGTPGRVENGLLPSTYRVRYDLKGEPRVTILIPTKDRVDLLRQCIDSIRELSTYANYEITIIDNASSDPATLEYLATFGGTVLRYPHRFNYARMMNLGGWTADGDLLLFLNNDTSVIAPDWIESLVEHAQRPEVGAVGCRLLYPNGDTQHEGVVVDYAAGKAGNVDHGGWWGFGEVVRNVTAVTGAVTMMRPSVFAEVGGFEERFRVAWNDVDLCLRIRQAGYRVVYTPYALLYHHESASRGFVPHPEDDAIFDEKWAPREYRDPYYNPNLDRSYPFRIYS